MCSRPSGPACRPPDRCGRSCRPPPVTGAASGVRQDPQHPRPIPAPPAPASHAPATLMLRAARARAPLATQSAGRRATARQLQWLRPVQLTRRHGRPGASAQKYLGDRLLRGPEALVRALLLVLGLQGAPFPHHQPQPGPALQVPAGPKPAPPHGLQQLVSPMSGVTDIFQGWDPRTVAACRSVSRIPCISTRHCPMRFWVYVPCRLDEHDEATRVAMMLNDPSTSREVRSAASAAQQQQQAAAAHGTGAVRGSHQQPYASPRAPPSPGAAVSPPRHEASSPGQGQYMTDGQRNRSSEISEQYYNT